MALKPVLLLLLWDLTLFAHGVTSLCNVTCSTDYDYLLNCSCSGSLPTYSVLIEVVCRDGEYDVNGSCEVKSPQSWCVMYPEELYIVASIGTMCTATVSHKGHQVLINDNESSTWALSKVVKPLPPVDVQVARNDGCYNVTWEHDHETHNILIYRVRVRQSNDLSKDPVHYLEVGEKYSLLDCEKLQPHVNYIVDVQAKMSPKNLYIGPWSEWSSTAEWRTAGNSAQTEGMNGWWWYVTLAVSLLFVFLLLGYSQKPCWQKKLRQIIYIPRPDEFFKPLDKSYEGNFKEWVKPLFNECDYLQAQMMSNKQHDVLQWNTEKQSYSEDNEMKHAGHFLPVLQPHSNSLLFFQDGDSFQGTGHSTGHISIHTVTLSGEEEFEEEVGSQSSVNTLRSYQGGESFGSFEEDNREHAGYDLEESRRQSGILPPHENQISNNLSLEDINFQPREQLDEPERVSLNSFVSNEQSEDGYPHVDLDTIDSGFGECSSPGASDSNMAEQRDSDLFQEHKSSNSNYVKQWMICSTTQEDSSNLENELQETQ
ncbi:interleukin 21 receptor, tandem duplicate 1 [Plectropomus leopardus]|uniref:interleukin 21 receptor, tandem duplicate 1 n=1 Tax=Plectropomus leopardus TaxID=160734 RepID=UPI001C4D9159|nr:interleukin 21 receptor, tandem duplicate 1 [Plectropomus leopardus]XP_042346784.1 interleukin 21 receptor, tandem duplicate 1 [Plectropomus leopardus]XP_042346785.1 interleukin 21 receptor, tandem duplicate 1 [Plectropomus leopardus]XP_042346786.1 interleukin 21 receptor, tandem duplicate 1 [Plectropomus leopardus]